MSVRSIVEVRPDVADALAQGRPVVALESSLIAQGLPWPVNLETARAAENAVRDQAGVPATIAVFKGRPTIGLSASELEVLARGNGILKASRRDLPVAVVKGQTAGTTVAATMYLAAQAGIRVFATGGIGGAHRGAEHAWDISADLHELARNQVAVVCSGAKNVLDIPRTLEILESLSVPVVGYGTDRFPGFLLVDAGEPVTSWVNTPEEAAHFIKAHWALNGQGVVLAQTVPAALALQEDQWQDALAWAEAEANRQTIHGAALTPFLLAQVAKRTNGKSLRSNQALVISNAALAARIAAAFASQS
jgi:pseudouridine-5'-phosphate glycosidase